MEQIIQRVPRLMLAAPASGQGKTSMTCALLQAALWAGREPCAFKCGPDYIDPMFYQSVLGVPSRNLDLYFSRPEAVRSTLCTAAQGHSLSVLEGVMGFYDGIGDTDRASSWHLAQETQTPVVLSVIPKGTSLTLAAILKGLQTFRSPSQLRGVILNQCSEKLFSILSPAIRRETGLEVYGYLPKVEGAEIPSRHLGLVTAQEITDLKEKIEKLARQMEQSVDISGLLALADTAPALVMPDAIIKTQSSSFRIGVAHDRAFCFYYEENLEQLRQNGAELVPFSPLEDSALPDGICGLYLGGGYPELYAGQLSKNAPMRGSVQAAIQYGMPALAECGGFLYLQETLEDCNGHRWPMSGIFPGHGFPKGGLGRFGYIELTAKGFSPYLLPGERIRGHEFHHWDCTQNGTVCRAQKPASNMGWDCIVQYKRCFAGFPHLYFQSNPAFASRFAGACRRFGEEAL